MKTTNLLIIALLMIFAFPLQAGGETAQAENPAVVMCRPTTDQIKNIAVMRSAGLFGDIKFDLICVYHENELTGYDSSRKYVSGSGLKWVSFAELKGRVEVDGLFRENVWTSQFREIFEASDGIIFTGGMDIPPGIYLEKNSLLTEATTPYRTLYETSFLFHLIGGSRNSGFRPFLEDDPEYPVLGICLGSQTMNVAAGGSLVQDIPSELYGLRTVEQVLRLEQDKIHSSRYVKLMYPGSRNEISPAFHRIKVLDRSVILKSMVGKEGGFPMVLSSHHQSVKKLGKDLFVTATSMDGKIVEAIEHKKYKNVLGVQFHPEYRNLHKGLNFVTNHPKSGKFFSLKNFLKKNPPSTEFHKNLWSWFSVKIKR